MTNSNNSTPTSSVGFINNPWLAAGLSLLIPGLGQTLLGLWKRGLSTLLTVFILIAIILWQDLPLLFISVAFIWLWNVWDAYSLPLGLTLSFLPPLLATLIVVYVAGWIITEIEPKKLFEQANRAAPIVRGMLNPDYLERESESREDRAPFEVHCSDNPPPTTSTLEDGTTITLSQSCGEVGDPLSVAGTAFWPTLEMELWWANPIGDEQRLTKDKQQIVVTSGAQGEFAADIIVPLAVPLSQDSGEPQTHYLKVKQTRIVGGLRLSDNGRLILEKMAETLSIALMATTFAVIFAVPLSFLAARNLMSASSLTLAVYFVVRTFLNIIRSIEPLIIAIIFVVWVGLGPFAGVMALTIHSIAALGKLYSEQVENIEFGPIEAVRTTGANWWQIVIYSVLPQVVPLFVSFTIYRWDINVRTSTILGFVGGGGIGFLIVQWQRLSQWQAIGAAFWSIMVVVALLDYVSAKARQRLA